MWIMTLLAAMAASPTAAPPAITLPLEIKMTLDQEYPGWKFAHVQPAIQKEFAKKRTSKRPSLTVGDFDANGKKDFIVQIALTPIGQEEQIVIAFLAKEGGYEETILQSMGLDPNVYVWVQPKKLPETGPDAQEKMALRDTLLILGNPAATSCYVYNSGRFTEIPYQEDPGDTAIPYIAPEL